jgi:hypothetical protein
MVTVKWKETEGSKIIELVVATYKQTRNSVTKTDEQVVLKAMENNGVVRVLSKTPFKIETSDKKLIAKQFKEYYNKA